VEGRVVSFRFDPYKNFKFHLEIDGIIQAGFRECFGLDHATTEDEAANKLSGLNKAGDVTLKRGVIGETALLEWVKAASEGQTARKSGSIIQVNEAGEEKVRWNFVKGWPIKLDGPSLDASGDEIAVETLEIAHEGLTTGHV
jgi:phage tail-like protein